MSLFLKLALGFAGCALAVWLLPAPKYGELRCGCTGRALQAVLEREKMEQEKRAREKAARTPEEKP